MKLSESSFTVISGPFLSFLTFCTVLDVDNCYLMCWCSLVNQIHHSCCNELFVFFHLKDVGRSCILVTIGGKNIMLDCGMHMGYNDEVLFFFLSCHQVIESNFPPLVSLNSKVIQLFLTSLTEVQA